VIHPATRLAFINDEIGLGVVATERLPMGSITWVQDPLDQVLAPEVVAGLGPALRDAVSKYAFVDRDRCYVLCWDIGRYMNHSCEANTFSPGLDFDIAVRDIEVGEQLTSDYASFNLQRPLTCCCGTPRCRGTVQPEDFERFAAGWDALVAAAFARIPEVPQPLWDLVTDRAAIHLGLQDPERIPSILVHRVG